MSSRYVRALLCVAIGAAGTGGALAQSAAELNPAVNTSAAAPPAPGPASAPAAARPAGQDRAPPAPANPRSSSEAARRSRAARARARLAKSAAATALRPPAARGAAPPPATQGAAGSGDRIELDTTEISGNRELPKLLYIVPWQRAEVGKITGRPPNSLVDEALSPVDRSVFGRQNSYYAALQAASASAPSQPSAAGVPPAAAAGRDEK